MDKFKSVEYADRVITQSDCDVETKDFLKKVLRMEHNSLTPASITKKDYFRILVDSTTKKVAAVIAKNQRGD